MSQYTEKEPSVMDQESNKAAWPKPAGGYQTITGRRYGRRHAYVSFKPCMTRHERSLGRAGDDYEVLELDDVPKENSSGSNSLDQVHPSLLNEPTFEKSEAEIPTCGPALNQTTESSPSIATVCPSEEVRETLESNADHHNHTEAEYYSPSICKVSSVQNGIVLVHTDLNDPDSKHDEKNDSLQLSAEAVEGGRCQEVLGNTVFELENGEAEVYADLSSSVPSLNCEISDEFEELDPAPLENSSTGDAELVHQNGQEFQRSSEDDIVRKRQQGNADEGRQTENSTEDVDCVPGHICSEQITSGRANHHASSPEQVVRPKVRKVISSSQVDQEIGFNRHEAKQRSVQRWREALEVEECSADDPIMKYDDPDVEQDCMFLTPPYSRAARREAEHNRATSENGATASGRQEARDNSFWNGCGDYYQLYDKDEDREQTSLEEGEIPWLQYNEVNESSSDEGNEPANEFAQPEAFMLDGNNNLEDDSSVSEDLDVDWSLFDGFADGLGVAEAISYVDPQFLTYMALEERLAQAMETALAHLESLAVDVEVANPPASKESIDGLPETLVLEDHTAIGQEQCCPICCSEYIKDDIATELPCHHFFHKPCVSIWLQKSGTCPVCRRHFPPAVIEASAAASSDPDPDAPPANDNAAEAP
ncbi:E3 ubiquitin-protein ligase Praja-2 isoform X4 [Peromyscus californicus insignis]|uniref:E3 ubiquitin-protein ligase Praja-2 isoform X4 n=1 Tax=Peromyscus californicus insignis TaxID=564181 RepID=UPI0022A6CCCF|nr:E3 ubiquitin-protein ligase Praja-2 isoform X4 [Peromyscus californicus insignis]